MKILIVDDEEMIREMLQQHFQNLNHEVDTVSDGIECGAKLLENDYDALIIDLMMPNQDGIKTIKYLRKGISEKNKKLKIVMVTGSREMDIENMAKEYDINYLFKPVDIKKLTEIIEK